MFCSFLQLRIEAKHFYSVTILNGGMSIDERNAAMREFKTSTSIFISTDAGGEGLNLQFANIIIKSYLMSGENEQPYIIRLIN